MKQVLIERTPSRIDAIRAYRRQNCEFLGTQPLCKTCQFREEYGYEEEGNRRVSYQPIENYGIIGNIRTVALVGMNGSIQIPRLRYSPGLAPTTRLNALLNAASDS